MFKNYFLVAFRTIVRQKFYSGINILGLTLGIAISFLITLYILDELSYDRFNTNIDNMYQLDLHGKIGGQEVFTSNTAPVIASALVREIPQVDQSLRVEEWDDVPVKYGENAITENKICIVDSNFFNFFSYKLIKGDPDKALAEPNSVVMTEKSAKKFFGDDDPIGKMVMIGSGNDMTFRVTGIAANPPENSHMKFNYLVSMSSYKWMTGDEDWLDNYMYTYFSVHPGADLNLVQKKLDQMVVDHVGPRISQMMGVSLDQFLSQNGAYGYIIFPVRDIHLYSNMEDKMEPGGNISYIYIFGVIGLFIILIASINFMNLATARSAGRSKEIGLRKTFGSMKNQLVGQFLLESIMFSLIAMLLSFLVVGLLLPQFNEIAGKSITFSSIFNSKMILSMLAITVFVGFLSGSYPAFYLTRFRISEVMKGQAAKGVKGKGLRGVLVVLQFSLSIILIICTIFVYRQLQYIQHKNLGFDKQNVLVIPNMNSLGKNEGAFKDKLMRQSDIVAASFCSNVIPGASQMTVFRKPGSDQDYLISRYWADYEQVPALGLQLIEGRNFSRDFPSDSTATLINEAVVKQFGWDDPIGKEIISFGDDGKEIRLRVIGVLKDFNFESLRQEVRPLMINLRKEEAMMAVRYNDKNPKEAIDKVRSIWKEFAPGEPFNYGFLDQNFDSMYKTEQHLGKLFTAFTFFAIFIACMGLLGLSAFTTEQRTREIGIRKALGATGASIVGLLSKEFTKYILISFLIATLPAWYIMHKWLEGFAFRINLNVMVFVVSGVIAFLVAIATISYQSVKAARINPATSLRYE